MIHNDLGLTDKNDGCACHVDQSEPTTSISVESGAHQEVYVAGMTCSHCVMSVTEEISDIEGVDTVVVDLNAGGNSKVVVTSSSPIDAATLRAAVEEAGYQVAELLP